MGVIKEPQFVVCGLEMGRCTRQISYDMAYHDKVVREVTIMEILDKIASADYCNYCEYRKCHCTNDCRNTNNELYAVSNMLNSMLDKLKR